MTNKLISFLATALFLSTFSLSAEPAKDPGAANVPAQGQPPQAVGVQPDSINPNPEAWSQGGGNTFDTSSIKEAQFNGLPASEVAMRLKETFSNQFDVLIGGAATDVGSIPVNLQLRNVTATEIFNAMNIQFAITKSPVRWTLLMNGNRATAVLHIVDSTGPPPTTKVYFVGGLIGNDRKADFAKLNEIIKKVCISDTTIYADEQLLVCHGTEENIDCVEQTLRALKEKAEWQRKNESSKESSPTGSSQKP